MLLLLTLPEKTPKTHVLRDVFPPAKPGFDLEIYKIRIWLTDFIADFRWRGGFVWRYKHGFRKFVERRCYHIPETLPNSK